MLYFEKKKKELFHCLKIFCGSGFLKKKKIKVHKHKLICLLMLFDSSTSLPVSCLLSYPKLKLKIYIFILNIISVFGYLTTYMKDKKLTSAGLIKPQAETTSYYCKLLLPGLTIIELLQSISFIYITVLCTSVVICKLCVAEKNAFPLLDSNS